jgi:predicted permease
MNSLLQQMRHGVRLLRKNPGFTAVAVLVLGLGIGANTAMFTLTNNFLFRPLAAADPEELVGCFSKDTRSPNSYRTFSYPNYVDIRDRNSAFTSLLAHDLALVGLTEGDTTRRVFADVASSNYFSTLGVQLFRGRAFTPEEERPGSSTAVVIVSYDFWRKRGESPDLLGQTLRINGRPFTIIGIAPVDFTGTTAVGMEMWLPLGSHDIVANDFDAGTRRLADRDNHRLFLVGRLRPGVKISDADALLAPLAARLAEEFPKENKDQTFIARPLSRISISSSPQEDDEIQVVSLLLTALAGAVLLIACLNLANMMLARGAARRKEFAIRLALGGGRGTVLRQLMTEGMVLSIMGGLVGLLLAWWSTRLLVASLNAMLPIRLAVIHGPDGRVLAALFGFCVLSALLFGFGPAWKASRPDLMADLRENVGETASPGRGRRLFSSRNLIVIGQLALSLALLATAGLFIRGALQASGIDPGFKLSDGLLVELDTSMCGYDEARGRQVYALLLERLRTLPGVESASIAVTVPFGMISLGQSVIKAEDANVPASELRAQGKTAGARYNIVGEGYFRTLGLRVLRGREFTAADTQGSPAPAVAIVNESLARRLWPQEDPLGKQIRFLSDGDGQEARSMEVVGVVPDIRQSLFDSAAESGVFVPFGQEFRSNANVHLRLSSSLSGGETTLLPEIRRAIRSLDERLPVLALRTLRSHFEASLELWIIRTAARMFSVFGIVAVFLAVVGVYGVRSYVVARRSREIGIRMAMGATSGDTVRWIVREGLGLTGIGLAAGLLIALAAGRLLSSMLYRVSPADPLVFLLAPGILAGAALLACYVPARRASRVDPIVALRCE